MDTEQMFEGGLNGTREVFSLSQVLHSLENTVRKEFPYSFWLKADISKLNFYKYSGHCYPDLVEKEDGVVTAQMRAIIWRNDYQRINEKFLQTVRQPLQDGISIVCNAKITFHALYGLSLIIYDIDPALTLGQMEKERAECIQRLKESNMFDLNRKKAMPELPKRLAVVSVPTSKGYNDFVQTVEPYKDRYGIRMHLFASLLQGDAAAYQLTEALNAIRNVVHHFDCVLIIRGGGGDIGMNCYNEYGLCHTVAEFPLPVLTGIGHSTNETVAEMVACRNFITPTALAEFIVGVFAENERQLTDAISYIAKVSGFFMREEHKNLEYIRSLLSVNVRNIFDKHYRDLDSFAKYLSAVNPQNILNKGYTITTVNGEIIKSISQIKPHMKIVTRTADGEFESVT
ncbi:MAG: exodeoxyribonuclease VII large subunit [Bacteroidales bacterium]|nr:exodeoxyribonuclease VII large subunit [Bacteroidales bacterium]